MSFAAAFREDLTKLAGAKYDAAMLAAEQRQRLSGLRGHAPRPGEWLLPFVADPTTAPTSFAPRLPWVFRGGNLPPTGNGSGVLHASRYPQVAAAYAAGSAGTGMGKPKRGELLALARRGFHETPAHNAVFLSPSTRREYPTLARQSLIERMQAYQQPRTAPTLGLSPHYEAGRPWPASVPVLGRYKVRKVMAGGNPAYAVSRVSGMPVQQAFKGIA